MLAMIVCNVFSECPAATFNDRLSIQVGDLKRFYRVYLPPSYDGTTPVPLVLVFHGRSQGSKDIAEIAGFNQITDRYGFIMVYPVGIHEHWNDGRIATPIWSAGNYDDVGFIETLLAHLEHTFAVDTSRIYATGMSNGGMFVQRLACELPGVFAAIAPVSGTLPSEIAARCTASQHLSIVEFHGTRDAYVHWDGGSVRALGGKTLSVPKTLAHWQHTDGCPSTPTITYPLKHDRRDHTRIQEQRYGPCQNNSEVVLYVVEGGGHTWPGGPADHSLPFLGRVTHEISATDVILAFFKDHPESAMSTVRDTPPFSPTTVTQQLSRRNLLTPSSPTTTEASTSTSKANLDAYASASPFQESKVH